MGMLEPNFPADLASADGIEPEAAGADADVDLAAIDGIVRDGTPAQRWPAALTMLYEGTVGSSLLREATFLLILGAGVSFSTIAVDLLVNPAMVEHGMALRVVATGSVTALGLFAVARRHVAMTKIMLGAGPIAFLAVLAHLSLHVSAVDAARYMLGASLTLAIGNMTLPFSIRGLAVFNFAGIATGVACVAAGGAAVLAAQFDNLVTMALIALATLPLAARIERLRRHNFLLDLRTRLVSMQLVDANSALRELSDTDPLTGVGNRRWFERQFAERIEQQDTETCASPWVGLMMIDLDHFKPFNDHHGHQAGDSCLRLVANSLREVFDGPGALFARYGGEEFIAALCADDPESITQLAEEARMAVASRLAPIEGGGRALITASIGVAIAPAAFGLMREELVEMADAALYSGKNAGRNRVEVVEAGPASEPGDDEARIENFG